MATSTTQAECQDFAREFPTPAVQRAIALAESGRLAWSDIHALFTRSLGKALTEIREG